MEKQVLVSIKVTTHYPALLEDFAPISFTRLALMMTKGIIFIHENINLIVFNTKNDKYQQLNLFQILKHLYLQNSKHFLWVQQFFKNTWWRQLSTNHLPWVLKVPLKPISENTTFDYKYVYQEVHSTSWYYTTSVKLEPKYNIFMQ